MQRSELGQTRDPAALVPGSPGSVRRTAATMAQFATPLGSVGEDLGKIDDGGWSGLAADRFHEVFDLQPSRWVSAGDTFLEASDALGGYAHTLEWAQGRAADAIALWDQAEEATRQAQTVSPGASADPGEAGRQAARSILDDARRQLDEAGNHAETVVARARDKAPDKPRWLGSGDNSDDGFTGTSLGPHQAVWCLDVGLLQCWRAKEIKDEALQKANELADKYGWSTGERNAFRHSYWMGLMTAHGFSYDEATALGEAHEKDTDTAGELPGSKDSNADLHNNSSGARLGVDIRPWYVGAFGFGIKGEHKEELERRLIAMLHVCTEDGSLEIVE